jgi:hypothetical protein
MAKAKTPIVGGQSVAQPQYKVGNRRPPLEHQFKPGNPGRPKGSRNKLGEHFIGALCADFETHGPDVITRVREKDPAVYLRVIASVVPQTIVHEARLDELSDDELALYLGVLRDALSTRDTASEKREIATQDAESHLRSCK